MTISNWKKLLKSFTALCVKAVSTKTRLWGYWVPASLENKKCRWPFIVIIVNCGVNIKLAISYKISPHLVRRNDNTFSWHRTYYIAVISNASFCHFDHREKSLSFRALPLSFRALPLSFRAQREILWFSPKEECPPWAFKVETCSVIRFLLTSFVEMTTFFLLLLHRGLRLFLMSFPKHPFLSFRAKREIL